MVKRRYPSEKKRLDRRNKEQLRQTAPEEGSVAWEGGFWRLSKLTVPASDDPDKDFLPPARPDAGAPPASRSQREAAARRWLSSYAKDHSWLNRTGEHLVFPPDESEFKGGAKHYIDTIDEMAPDLDWGKNIRIALDIGCKSAGFGVALLEKAHEL
ncbi:putative methyltransferase PMT28 [Hordeum vulgare]|nr:putative methyltransferase PMT28 [Hordeum vulgare]